MTNVEALKALYTALGGDAADVADATTITAVLNIIAAKYEGADDATTNAEAIANIADVAGSIEPGGSGSIKTIRAIAKNATKINLYMAGMDITVDWGDGTEPQVIHGDASLDSIELTPHEYATLDRYVVKISVDNVKSESGEVVCYTTIKYAE